MSCSYIHGSKHNPMLYRIIHVLGVATVCIRIPDWMGLIELPKLMIEILIPSWPMLVVRVNKSTIYANRKCVNRHYSHVAKPYIVNLCFQTVSRKYINYCYIIIWYRFNLQMLVVFVNRFFSLLKIYWWLTS